MRVLRFLPVLFATAVIYEAVAQSRPVLPSKAPEPPDNPSTPAKVELGKMLFFDPRLSETGTVSCNSCHNLMAGGDDNLAGSIGIRGQVGGRSAPTVWNAAFLSALFWDGRAATLEEQAKGPLVNPIEMGMKDHAAVVARLEQIPGYVKAFEAAFGGSAPVTIDNAARAIAAFERTLITPNSAYDRFAAGDAKALSAEAKRGLALVEEIGCVGCHGGANFAGPELPQGQGFYQKFPVLPGTAYEKKYRLTEDPGRFQVTNAPGDKNVWRVATWRNVALTAPYFHNGSVATLDEAVRVMAKTQLGRDLTEAQVKDVVAFLTSLTGEFPAITMPRLPDTPGRALLPSGIVGH